jgi:hypothetical protein
MKKISFCYQSSLNGDVKFRAVCTHSRKIWFFMQNTQKKNFSCPKLKSNRDPALHVKLNEKYRAFLADHPGLTAKVTSVID